MSVLAAFGAGVLALLFVFGVAIITWLFVSEFKLLYRRRRYDRSGHKRGSR